MLPWIGFSQPIEEQYKFRLPDSISEFHLLESLNGICELSTLQHSGYVYHDAYLDTPNDLLLNNGFSLRIRKRVWNDTTITYSMQLKSEMSKTSAIRVEVEEKELDFYRFLNFEKDTLLVTDLLDQLFYTSSRRYNDSLNAEFEFAREEINSWIQFIAEQPITPFQYLNHLDSLKFDRETLNLLEVKLVGTSYRIRGHVFTTSSTQLAQVPREKKETPIYFQKNEDAVWLMETSLDYSRFYSVDSTNAFFDLREFEVENKYPQKEIVRPMIEQFSLELQKKFGLMEQQDSKYRQIRLLQKLTL